MRKFRILITIFITVYTACKSSNNPPNPIDCTGVVETSLNGTILKDNPADWHPRIGSDSTAILTIWPAYPNPPNGSQIVTIDYMVTDTLTLEMRVINREGRRVKILLEAIDIFPADIVFRSEWNLTDTNNNRIPIGIYQVVISASNADTSYNIFGNICVDQ